MKYENYGLIQESWDRFVINEQASRALLESLTTEKINEMFDTVGQPSGPIEKTSAAIGKFIKRVKDKVLGGAGLVAIADIMVDLDETGISPEAMFESPYMTAILTVAIMNQFSITKKQAIQATKSAAQTVKDQGPDAARQAAAATADAARVAGKKTVEYTNRVANDSRASPFMKSLFRNLSVILSPEELENPEEVMTNEPELRRRVKQITDKTLGSIKDDDENQ
tara:strand:- start:64 stop:735 length:672 start_codon:yes stop_codon:yes gene_type:complete